MAIAEDGQEYLLKAAFIYKFAQVVAWPDEKSVDKQVRLDICTIGDVPLEPMHSIFDEASIGSVRFSIVEEKHVQDVDHCHALFIGASEQGKAMDIVSAIKNKPILTIGNIEGFIDQGGMIGFVARGGKIKFEVNTKAMAVAGMRVKAELLEIAVRVIR